MHRFLPDFDGVSRVSLKTLAPASLTGAFWLVFAAHGWRVVDFLAVRSGATALLHGLSPYDDSRRAVLASQHLVYPPLTGYLFVPFAVLPTRLAIVLYLLLSIAAVALALRLLEVRDWRCYAVVALWQPFFLGLIHGVLSPLLVLALAAVWRWRDRIGVAVVVAAAIVAKLFLWPLLLWLVATRRWRLAAAAAAGTLLGLCIPFLGLGANVAWSYVKLIGEEERIFGGTSFSTTALFHALGLSRSSSHAALLCLAFVAEAAIVALARRPDGDRRSFVAAIAAALLLSPIVWSHYFILLLVPIALRSRTFSGLWLVPIGLWGVGSASLGSIWRLVFVLVVVLPVLLTTVRGSSRAQPVLSAEQVAASAS